MWRLYCGGLFLGLLFLAGCSREQQVGIKKTDMLPISKVPESVMKVAREQLPDVTFEKAWKTPGGNWEVGGKTKSGKERDVQITPEGKVVEVD
jgi:hypothetical protein